MLKIRIPSPFFRKEFMKQKEQSRTVNPVQPQSSELDAELFPSNNSDDTIFLNGEKTMSQKFDFDSLVAAEKQVSLDDLAEYQIVLREIARDKCERPKAEILRLLERCERDTSDLKGDVEWRVERDEKIAEINRKEEYLARETELHAQAKVLDDEFAKVQAEYQAARNPISWERDAISEKLRTIDKYRYNLYESCRDTNLKLELETVEASFDHRAEGILEHRQYLLDNEIKELKCKHDEKVIKPYRAEEKQELKRKIRELQEEWQKLELKKGEITQKKIEYQQAIDAIREKMIFS